MTPAFAKFCQGQNFELVYDIQLALFDIFVIFTGVFSFVLRVHDLAGNAKIARRFVFHDVGSRITQSETELISVTSASAATRYKWITELAVLRLTTVTIDWTRHFSNHDHDRNGLLNEVRDFKDLENGRFLNYSNILHTKYQCRHHVENFPIDNITAESFFSDIHFMLTSIMLN